MLVAAKASHSCRLNAAIAPCLLRTGRASAPYVASQGTALGRAGRVHGSQDSGGTIWTGGGTGTCVTARSSCSRAADR